jgi:hypothetical protein
VLRVAAAALAATAGVAGFAPGSDGARPKKPKLPAIRFLVPAPGNRLLIRTPRYQLALDRATGAVADLIALPSGTHLLRGENGCLWQAEDSTGADVDACPSSPPTTAWDQRSTTLTVTYPTSSVTIVAGTSSFDLSLKLQNQGDNVLQSVELPADLLGPVQIAKAGYVPTYLPGIKLDPQFFYNGGGPVWTYPSRWAFADWLAFDAGGSSLALYTVNPAPNPIQPVDIGLVRAVPPDDCSGPVFCVRHRFETWIGAGTTWTSPTVRIQVGLTAAQSMLAYRHDNGIDAYPSLADKTGAALTALTQSPLIKADLKNAVPFGQWGPELKRLPSPALIHPVAFQPGDFDSTDPDFLPPDDAIGTTADMRGAVQKAHDLGQLVMPYLNISWWSVNSLSVSELPDVTQVAVQNRLGKPRQEQYGAELGWVVSPFAQAVKDRFAALLDEWRTQVPADCLFFDQIGARPWLRDFNDAAPTPLAYDDGWLALLTPAANRCLMVEDGWDRLAAVSSGFLGSLLLMQDEFNEPNVEYGVGTWQPYPLADWLLHDKVLLYQHDLYEPTMTADPSVLAWNLAFGFMLSYNWNAPGDTLSSPWLDVVGSMEHTLGPLYAGQPLDSYAAEAPDVTRTTFANGFHVLADWSTTNPYTDDRGSQLPPGGFEAASSDGSVDAGSYSGAFEGSPLSAGTHYLVVRRTASSVVVHQPLGPSTPLSVDLPSSWTPGTPLTATASSPGADPVAVSGTVVGRRFVFQCDGPGSGPAPTYVIGTGSQ